MKLRSLFLRLVTVAFFSGVLDLQIARAAESRLELKDNDVWVMAGDSITAQRLHTNYIEAFFRTRYPQLHLHFRNSGIGGNKASHVVDRFDYDVAPWKPTIVSVELGMNDVGNANPENKDCAVDYIAGMKKLADGTRAINAQPLFISSSPVNDGSLMGAWTSVRCHALHPFTEALKELAQKENIQMVDQYHPLIALWGPAKTLKDANSLAARVPMLKQDNISNFGALQAFAKSWEGKPAAVSVEGDVHPNPIGHYTMAATVLAALDVDREVSSATVKLDGTVVDAKRCKITDIVSKDGKLTFTRLDERSPWPLLPDGVKAAKLMPEIFDLSRYMLTVPGLPDGHYSVAMNGQPVATLSSEELARGWNMSPVVEGPLRKWTGRITTLINELQDPLNLAWRTASKEGDKEKLALAQRAIDECEAKLQTACQASPITFEIAPVK